MLNTIKDFKNVSSILPLFEIGLLKLTAATNAEVEEVAIKPVEVPKKEEHIHNYLLFRYVP